MGVGVGVRVGIGVVLHVDVGEDGGMLFLPFGEFVSCIEQVFLMEQQCGGRGGARGAGKDR